MLQRVSPLQRKEKEILEMTEAVLIRRVADRAGCRVTKKKHEGKKK